MTKPLPVFLDFEGVLRPAGMQGDFICAAPLLEALEAAKKEGILVGLVVASTHRASYSWRELAGAIDRVAPGIGSYFIGANPFFDQLETENEIKKFEEAPRYFESMSWLSDRRPSCLESGSWVAIDDTPSIWGRQNLPPQLLVCDSQYGFSKENISPLLELLRKAHTTLTSQNNNPSPTLGLK